MNFRAKISYINSVLLLISFILVFITGVIKVPELRLHRLGIPMANITFVHDWSGIIMGILCIVHVMLYWKVLVNMTKAMIKKKE